MKKTGLIVILTVIITTLITSSLAVFVVFPLMEPEPAIVEVSAEEDSAILEETIDAVEEDDHVKVEKEDYEYLVSLYEKYKKIEALEEYIKENYYQDVSEVDFVTGMTKGLFEALDDPYSQYFTADEFKAYTESASGEYEGIGVVVAPGDDGFITVVSPVSESPGFEAGLLPNDKILKVDGIVYFADELQEAVMNIRGPAESTVVLTIRRGDEEMEISVVRRRIKLEAVASEMKDNNIGYIQIASFDQDVAKEFYEHLTALEDEGMEGLIIDLRYNGGGYLNQCLLLTDMLLGDAVIVKTKDNQGNVDIERSGPEKIDVPLVVLVNEGSASASEILTGAVKDNEEGIIIGTTTFGKGLVQTMLPLTSFDDTGFKLTIEQYFTPNDHYIHGVGIEPNIMIEDDKETEADEQLEKAIEVILEEMK